MGKGTLLEEVEEKKTHTTDVEVQTLQVCELGRGEGQEPGCGIGRGTDCLLVFLEGIGGEENQSGTYKRA